ncbi:MAG: hypothetical protein H6621_03460 [Halobacteriovoraceae bacterium]|nr:hypothetical protein [Halobacteriovoraceae bacterium]MCB9094105.1 hypothetical protein [Halobacteriovoraceae bacterium]
MKKRNFTAQNWLRTHNPVRSSDTPEVAALEGGMNVSHRPESPSRKLPSFMPRRYEVAAQLDFQPSQYLDLEWLAENLTSKAGYVFFQSTSILKKDILKNFQRNIHFPKKRQISFYDEFVAFAESKNLNIKVDSYQEFWKELFDSESLYREELDLFIDDICFKIAVIYLLKIRFFKALCNSLGKELEAQDLLSPNSLFLRYFKKSSSSEFESAIVQSNHYTWYIPSAHLKDRIYDYYEVCDELTYVDITTVLSQKFSEFKSSSHSLAHKNTGLFINCLILNFFEWLEKNKHGVESFDKNQIRTITTKFVGDHVVDLTSSHWLAQYNNNYFKWSDLICPEFEVSNDSIKLFLKLINEVELYTFLVGISSFYSSSAVEFISFCAKEFKQSRSEPSSAQGQLLLEEISQQESSYDRIVVSQVVNKKRNTHFYLLQKIQEQAKNLKEDGYIVVLTNQNLFIHSQKEKTKSLLKNFNLETVIQLQDVSLKGEFPPYIYLLSKKSSCERYTAKNKELERYSCFNFRVIAQLDSYNDFASITNQLNGFFEKHLDNAPAFYREDFYKGFQMEFFQNAIINGELIQSTSDDSSHITHPHFFKKMMKNCLPFGYFFELNSLNIEEVLHGKNKSQDQLKFQHYSQSSLDYEDFNGKLILILNFNNVSDVKIEITTFDLLKSKSYQYGITSCYYYILEPKFKDLNINIFREYLYSKLGKQMIQMTFSGSYHQAKSRISGILVPKSFAFRREIPKHLKHCFEYLLWDEKEILKSDFESLARQLEDGLGLLKSLSLSYSLEVISYLTNFKIGLYNCSKKLSWTKTHIKNLDFNHGELKEKILECPTIAFYPNNEDLFIEYHGENTKVLPKPFTKKIINVVDDEQMIIEIWSEDLKILSVHCSHYLGTFLNFIFSKMINVPVIQILKNLRIPKESDVRHVISQFINRSTILKELYQNVDRLLEETFHQLVSDSSLKNK